MLTMQVVCAACRELVGDKNRLLEMLCVFKIKRNIF